MPSARGLVSPVGQTERIIILDSLRGIAILGILLMNTSVWFTRMGMAKFDLLEKTTHEKNRINKETMAVE